MAEIHPATPLPPDIVPDDLTLVQFILDTTHPCRPARPHAVPWLVDAKSGRGVGLEEIRARVYGLANALSMRYGIQENDVVCLFSPNHVDYTTALWAVWRLGGIVTLSNPAFTPAELAYQLTTTKTTLIIAHASALAVARAAGAEAGVPAHRYIVLDDGDDSSSGGEGERARAHRSVRALIAEGARHTRTFVERRLRPGEARTKIALFCFSSGTTGRPKAVAIAHYAPIANVLQTALFNRVHEDYAPREERRFRPGDVSLALLPFFHVYGLITAVHFHLFAGLSLVVVPKFNFGDMLRYIEQYRVTHMALVPPQVVLLCKSPETRKHDLSSVRFVLFGAAPVSAELTDQLVQLMPHAELGQAFGMTELATLVLMFPLSQRIGAPGSAGQLVPGCVAKIVKPGGGGALAARGEPGELVIKTPSVALGYYGDPEATAETFVDGWVRTGDEVVVDEEGNFFVKDRLKELIKVRGFQVAPAELEGHLLGHPRVADACVVGVPDEYSGEVPMAFVVLKADPTGTPTTTAGAFESEAERAALKAELAKFVADAKVGYKRLAGGVEFIDAVPKNPSGKLLRRVLRERGKEIRARAAAGAGAGAGGAKPRL
ncbi:hypothetical protein HETIRDRAFT_481951 [Heterobasidion irregulare TC 32-1]|uniref:Uncharacterized protein n=1 Tax=Heterobasidion irregulare (strain TC 32-1) TaxID=747525 RepID=W4JNZ1_HETIT|nr:uncharacterized protein HETIRDRAFT_481951 [Heterobasidion irregulare TC 32-1]ETW75263.1 hypothetical protein HETIRDRAFT_481951 [Heterobasidion irregulare TC 32-1]